MIVFDLKCGGGHVFEAWFASSGAFQRQQDDGLLACPVCGDGGVDKAVMAPRVGAKGNRSDAPSVPATPGDQAKALLAAVAAAQAKALKDSRWVGSRFAEEARAMHDGDTPQGVIHGQATADEARALAEDGIAAMPLLVPVVPPESRN